MKSLSLRTSGLVMGLAALLPQLYSCQDDRIPAPAHSLDGIVQFGIDRTSGTVSRSADESLFRRTLSRCGDTGLYLHTAVAALTSDGWYMSGSRAVTMDASTASKCDMGVSAWRSDGINAETYMADTRVDASDGYSYSPVVYWPSEDGRTLAFFAYVPYVDEVPGLTVSTEAGRTRLDYSVPDDGNLQTDILGGIRSFTDGQLTGQESVDFSLSHLLTLVSVATDGSLPRNMRIRKVLFRDIYNSGTYAPELGTWSVSGKPVSSIHAQWGDNESPHILTGEEDAAVFMLMPQQLPATASMAVTFVNDEGVESTVEAVFPDGSVWMPGTSVKYRISASEELYDFEVTLDGNTEAVFEWTGGNAGLNVTSSRTVYSMDGEVGTATAVEWLLDAVYTSSTAEDGSWLSAAPSVLAEWFTTDVPRNGGSDLALPLVVKASEAVRVNVGDDDFNGIQDINTSSGLPIYNLSNAIGAESVENTANCYIINAPGLYSLPLVYGNAIKNGADNPSAYVHQGIIPDGLTESAKRQILPVFLDYTGASITSPYMQGAVSAELLWQDEPGLITALDIVPGTNGNLLMIRTGTTLLEGNALVAVKDVQNRVMWSWHLWFTRRSMGTGNVADWNIGWCEAATQKIHPLRFLRLTFRQTKSGKLRSVIFRQDGGGEVVQQVWANNTCYQFGRKDPFHGNSGERSMAVVYDFVDSNTKVNGVDKTVDLTKNKPIYDIEGHEIVFWDGKLDIDGRAVGGEPRIVTDTWRTGRTDLMNIQTVIQHPEVFYTPAFYYKEPVRDAQTGRYLSPIDIAGWGNFSWNLDRYVNLWNTRLSVAAKADGSLQVIYTGEGLQAEKTIYDPSPVGWRVPLYSEMTRFINVTGEYGGGDEFSYPYYRVGGYDFHIIGGRRLSCGQMVRAQDPEDARGHYWVVEHRDAANGNVFDFEVFGSSNLDGWGNLITPKMGSCAYTDAISVRPVRE